MSAFITSLPTNTQTPAPNSLSTSPHKPKKTPLYKSPSQTLPEIEEQYINYIVTHSTKYSDIEKIEKQFKSLSIQKYVIYNKNKSKITSLKNISNTLTTEIYSSLVKHFHISIDSLLSHYNAELSKLRRLLKIKEHEQATYKTVYNRLYHNNIFLNKRIQSELEYADMYNTQHAQYQILKTHALSSFDRQYKKYEKMRNYDEVFSVQIKRELIQKAKLVNTLDYQIDLIKNDVKLTENKLIKYTNLGQVIQRKTSLQNQKYDVYYNDYLWVRKMYLKEFVEFNKILAILRVKNVNMLINKFNSLRNEYQSLLSQFKVCNNDVTQLNNTLTELDMSLIHVKQEVLNKQKNMLFTTIKQTSNDVEVCAIKSKITDIRLDITQCQELCDKKRVTLQSVMIFLLRNLRKLLQQGESIQLLSSNPYLTKLTNIITNTNKELTVSYEHIGSTMVIELCFIMRKCFECYFHLLFSSWNNIVNDYVRYSNENNNDSGCVVNDIYNKECVTLYQQYVTFSIKQDEDKKRIMRRKEKQLLSNLRTVEDKSHMQNKKIEIGKGVLYRNFIEYLGKDSVYGSKYQKKKRTMLVTINDTNNKCNGHLNSKSFVCNHPRHIMKIMDKYKNYLVVDDINIYKRNTSSNNSFINNGINNSSSNTYTNKHNTNNNILPHTNKQRNYLNNNTNTSSILSTCLNNNNNNNNNSRNQIQRGYCQFPKLVNNFGGNEEYDIDDDDYDEDNVCNNVNNNNNSMNLQKKTVFNTRKRKYEFYKNNPEMAIIHRRINDLRVLDLRYGNGMNTYNKVDNVDFSEAFYNFEKKYLKKSTVHNSSYSIANLKKNSNASKSSLQTLNSSIETAIKDKSCITTLNGNNNYYNGYNSNTKGNHAAFKRAVSILIKKKHLPSMNITNTTNSNNNNYYTFISNNNNNTNSILKKSSSFSYLMNIHSQPASSQ